MPRISVLLTCYNHIRFLPEALQSVLDQTFSDYEIIALDDGSTDGTREWLKKREDGKLRCIFNEHNIGTYGTLNVGLQAAKGEYICILNDDDRWAPRKLEAQLDVFAKHPKVGLVNTNGWFIDDSGKRHPDPAPMGFPFPLTPTGDCLALLIHHNKMITSSVMVRREAFETCGEFDPSFYGCGDWQMWLRIAMRYEIGHADEPLTFYRIHGTNAAWNDKKMVEDDLRIREWLSRWSELLDRKRFDPAIRQAVAHNLACLGTGYVWSGQARKGRAAYAKSIAVRPMRFKSYLRWAASFLPRSTFRDLDPRPNQP